MKIFALSNVLAISAVASAAFAPQGASLRLRRDVSELTAAAVAPEYVPPATEYLPASEAITESVPELGAEGYEYRTVRRLKLRHRNRRDVSHLYLPPPNAPYLPPPVADDTEEIVSAAEPKVVREYLPPIVVETEAPETEAPATEAPLEEEQAEPADVRIVDVPTAELLDDGYHYKQPETEVAAGLRAADKEYLPPPVGDAVVVEGPADGESAVLTKDGYQYRTVRRFRF